MAKKKKAAAKKAGGKKKSAKKATKKAAGKAGKKAAKKAKKSAKKAPAKKSKAAKKAAPKRGGAKAKGKAKAKAPAKKGGKAKAAKGRSGAGRAFGAAAAGMAAGAMLKSEGGSPSTEEEPARAIPEVGAMAPSFSLSASDGSTIDLGKYKGSRKVVLYFYPKDDTPGCTKQACDFSADWNAIQSAGAVVLGVSPDGVASHVKFRDKHRISFPLLEDQGAKVAKAYGAWGEKNMYGRTYHGIIRTTFLIDEGGHIARVWPKVRVEGHSQEVLAAIRNS